MYIYSYICIVDFYRFGLRGGKRRFSLDNVFLLPCNQGVTAVYIGLKNPTPIIHEPRETYTMSE